MTVCLQFNGSTKYACHAPSIGAMLRRVFSESLFGLLLETAQPKKFPQLG
jgi:hypothetical protein